MALTLLRHGRRKKRESHGYHCTPELQAWQHMLYRCYDPKDRFYKDYGARGIEVCPEWRESFIAFIRDMGDKPTPKHSLDRIDNTKGYSPDNCRWATPEEQGQNKRNNVNIEFNGHRYCIAEWARRTGINRRTIAQRLRKGWPVQAIIETPPYGARP